VPGTNRTYDLVIKPPSDVKALLRITLGVREAREPLTMQQFERIVDYRISFLLPNAVEEQATYHELPVNNGYGKYCILTDASLVNKKPDEDDYIYLGVYFANYNNGIIVYATLLADDIDGIAFQHMLKSVASIAPLFGNSSTQNKIYTQSSIPAVQDYVDKASTIPTLYATLRTSPEKVKEYGFIQEGEKRFKHGNNEGIYVEDALLVWLSTIDLEGKAANNFIREISQNFNSRYGVAEITNDKAKKMLVYQWLNESEKTIDPNLLGWMVVNFYGDKYISVQCIYKDVYEEDVMR
jgi:hypothetical protein